MAVGLATCGFETGPARLKRPDRRCHADRSMAARALEALHSIRSPGEEKIEGRNNRRNLDGNAAGGRNPVESTEL